MTFFIIALVVVGIPVAALLFGAESRDGRDWQSPDGLPSPLPDTQPLHTVGAGGSGLVHRHLHFKQS